MDETTTLAERPGAPVGVPQIQFTRDQIELIKRTVADGTTDDELALFLYQAKRTGLDPLAKQIHCVKRGGKMAIQTAIDGFRLTAERTGLYAGNDDTTFEGGDEAKGTPPVKATHTVWKMIGGARVSFTATARWLEYFPGDNSQGFMWKKMPFHMLGKCAEALAFRKAFPAELSGVYTDDEMDQADTGGDVTPRNATGQRPATQGQPIPRGQRANGSAAASAPRNDEHTPFAPGAGGKKASQAQISAIWASAYSVFGKETAKANIDGICAASGLPSDLKELSAAQAHWLIDEIKQTTVDAAPAQEAHSAQEGGDPPPSGDNLWPEVTPDGSGA